MPIVYSINFTDPAETSFTINPSQVDGPSGSSANTSLTLHGNGRLNYGERANENWLYLLENFASPQRAMPIVVEIVAADDTGLPGTHYIEILGDFVNVFQPAGYQFDIINSTGSINNGTYTVVSSSLISGNTRIILDEAFPDPAAVVIGSVSYTIIEPEPSFVIPPYIKGQLWFNKTDNNFYVFKEVSPGILQWGLAADANLQVSQDTDPPLFPQDGTLWYNETIDQLMVFHGGMFESVAERYVLKAGDTMAGDLNIVKTEASSLTLETTDLGTNAAGIVLINPDNDPLKGGAAGTLGYTNIAVRDGSILTIEADTSNTFPTATGTAYLTLDQAGDLTLEAGDIFIPNGTFTDPNHAITKSFVEGNFVLKTGDTITAATPGAGFIGRTDGVLIFENGANNVILNEGQGNVGQGPDLRIGLSGLVSVDNSLSLHIAGTAAGNFTIAKGSLVSDGSETDLFKILENGTIRAETPSYETLVLANNDIPNKKYVDDEITNITGGATSVVVENPPGGQESDGDILVTGTGINLKIFIWGDAQWNQVFPPVYAP